ncbi:RAMP superfamily CRISPR-associated protein [Methanohalophilus sp.]
MNIWKVSLRATSDFHTAGKSSGSTIDYLKNSENMPYIPATHIKGVMRTEAERIIRTLKDVNCWVTGDPDQKEVSENNKRKIRSCTDNSDEPCEVCKIFGSPNDDNNYSEGKIRVTDFVYTEGNKSTSARMHVSIDRDMLSNTGGGLYRTFAVPSGTVFSGYFIARNLSDDDNKLLWAALHSMCHYGLGGERSRGMGSFEVAGIEEIDYEQLCTEVDL